MGILDETFADIVSSRDIIGLKVVSLNLTAPFSMVSLSDGSVGSSANYFIQDPRGNDVSALPQLEKRLMEITARDPILFETIIRKDSANLIFLSLKVSLLSALSQSLLDSEYLGRKNISLDVSEASLNLPFAGIRQGDIVTAIGFGDNIAKMLRDDIKGLWICDNFIHDLKVFREKSAAIEQENPSFFRKIRFSDGSRNESILSESDVAVITASALCNRTMDSLLYYASRCRSVLVEGPSGSILPLALFRRNVSSVITILKDESIDGSLSPEDGGKKIIMSRMDIDG